ncbi:MAG: hypothetical protein AB1598_14410 [Thermodesulfobacteriota bacterium]
MMRNGFNILLLIITLCMSIALFSRESNALDYLPSGPQTNVPVEVVTEGGWTECFRNLYADNWDINELLANCPGTRLMLACRPTGSSTLTLLAQGAREDVTFDTGINETVLHIANGVGWYFNNNYSWGFVRAGDSVIKDSCDVDESGANDERLCWHSNEGGYRCGATLELNSSTDFERIVYTSDAVAKLSPIPTLTEWGLIAMAGVLGIAGLLIVIRKRKVTA